MNLNHISLQFLQQNADPEQSAPQLHVCITKCLFSLFLKVWSVLLKLQNSRKFIYTGAMLTTSTEQIPAVYALC